MILYSFYSPYKNTNIENDVRGVYNPIKIPFDDNTDYYYTIDKIHEFRPGLLAYHLYDTPRLEWIFSYFNKKEINDPIFDFKADLKIRVPTKERLMQYF